MKLRCRIGRLEARHRPLAVYPTYALFSEDGEVERVCLSDGSRLTGQEAIETYRRLPRSIPLKVYVGFDPDIVMQTCTRANHEPQEPA
jgi:hypothetical protein